MHTSLVSFPIPCLPTNTHTAPPFPPHTAGAHTLCLQAHTCPPPTHCCDSTMSTHTRIVSLPPLPPHHTLQAHTPCAHRPTTGLPLPRQHDHPLRILQARSSKRRHQWQQQPQQRQQRQQGWRPGGSRRPHCCPDVCCCRPGGGQCTPEPCR